MLMLILLVITTTFAGALIGVALSGLDGLILGGSTGWVLGVALWTLSNVVAYARRERRLNAHFANEQATFE